MKHRILALTLIGCALVLGLQTSLMGQIFFTEDFDYADGDLTAVSGGLWGTHSGGPPDIQVVDGDAVITAPGSMDDNRLTGVIMAPNDIWYYAVRFTVELGDGPNINNDYFIHFKDADFGYNARLATDAPADAANDFSLAIWASSGGDGQAPWVGDFSFGEELIAVVEWNNGTGEATLWVNPVDANSTSVVDDELPDAMRMTEGVALRQDSTSSSIITVAVMSTGTDFDAVLAEVTPVGGGGIVPAQSFAVTRGTYTSGGLFELEFSDNLDLSIRRAAADLTSRTEFTVEAVSPLAAPALFTVTLEGSVFARTTVNQSIELFDYGLGQWELVDTRAAARFNDSTVIIAITGDRTRFIEPGTQRIEARVRYQSVNARQNFASNTDQFIWTIE